MHIAVLAASGATGHQLARQALERGHTVTAIARHPEALDLPASGQLIPVRGDVRDATSIADAIASADVVVSGLGAVHGEAPGILLTGARALIDAHARRIIWLGAFGTGRSASFASGLTRVILGLALRAELTDKVSADNEILDGNGAVFHAGPLTNGPLSIGYTTVQLDNVRRSLVPASISRATVASAMLDEAEEPTKRGSILVPQPARRTP